ncbi:hypothetical protein EJ419_02770 [Alloscardovia theropitheci]|uniref:Uncharacterized protein n=2 Tax=Alloscardovia theropitheci TaxID=2496842 RepID=A0A4V2MU05_9BIFI|nr:hypothetical protein EJ419_02770 [Alloscardovia theropitheci]
MSEQIALSVAQELSMYELSLPNDNEEQAKMDMQVKAFGRHLCNQADEQLNDADFTLKSCEIEGFDVQVSIQGTPSMSFLPRPIRVSRAGPAECVPRNR